MSIEDAWKLYLEPGGKSVENRNRIVSLLYGPLLERLTGHLHAGCSDEMKSETGMVLILEVENATRVLGVRELATLIRERPFSELDCPPERMDFVKLAETRRIECDEYYTDRQREAWKTGPDSAVDDPTIRFRPISASLIAAEKRAEATGAASILVRESIE